ncbi:MAG: ribonuclease R [Parasphingorhabdus sp.]|jgi:ribonuclease R
MYISPDFVSISLRSIPALFFCHLFYKSGFETILSHISRKVLLKQLHAASEPLSLSELCRLLDVSGEKAGVAVLAQLDALKQQGVVIRNRRNRFALSNRMDMVVGRVIGHRDGYGFVENPGGKGDLFLSAREMRRVMHGDKVMARIKHIDSRGKAEGSVIELLETASSHVVGRFSQDHGLASVVPDDQRISMDIMIGPDDEGSATNGQIVVVEITEHPYKKRRLFGRVIEVLGDQMAAGMETEIAIRKFNLPNDFPSAVSDEVQSGKFTDNSVVPVKRRRDLTETPLITIDGADARDFDDAVFAESTGQGWRLLVAIADVSHYVKPTTALDEEAFSRGNSVYFPGRVIPMLPEQLSNGICSLKPGVDRYSMVCEMQLDSEGNIDSFEFYEAIINSHARLTYEQAQQIMLSDSDKDSDLDPAVIENIQVLNQLYKVRRLGRLQSGSLDLEIAEPFFELDSENRIKTVSARKRLEAHKLIEECMLCANICAATMLDDELEQGMFRVHDSPDEEKLSNLLRVCGGFGLHLTASEATKVNGLMSLVEEARQKRPAVADVLQVMVLRTMKQAIYSTSNGGHFALGFDSYTHFTSPIRRYPDLIVHRLIKAVVYKRDRRDMPDAEFLSHSADHCCVTERRADEATRDVYQWLKAEFMQEHVGESFDGVVSGVTQFGIFIQLNELFIDGLVHISELGKDYFRFDPVRMQLDGERSGKSYSLGTKVRIRVASVNLKDGRIDFVLDTPKGAKRKSGKWAKI